MATTAEPEQPARRPDEGRRTGAIVAGVLLVVGAFLLWTAARDGDLDLQGPRLAPLVVTAAWVAIAAAYLVKEAAKRTKAEPMSWRAPTGVAAALVGFAIALEYAGFVVSAAVFFVVTARFLGSRNWIRDVVVAIALPLAIYLAFTRLLDLFLPAGVLPL